MSANAGATKPRSDRAIRPTACVTMFQRRTVQKKNSTPIFLAPPTKNLPHQTRIANSASRSPFRTSLFTIANNCFNNFSAAPNFSGGADDDDDGGERKDSGP